MGRQGSSTRHKKTIGSLSAGRAAGGNRRISRRCRRLYGCALNVYLSQVVVEFNTLARACCGFSAAAYNQTLRLWLLSVCQRPLLILMSGCLLYLLLLHLFHPSISPAGRNSQPSLQVASLPRPAEHVFSSPGRVTARSLIHWR